MSGLKIHNNQVCDPDEHGLIAHDGQTIGSKLGKGRESEASQDTDLAALVLSLVAQRLADGCLCKSLCKMLKQDPLLLQQGSQQELRKGAPRYSRDDGFRAITN